MVEVKIRREEDQGNVPYLVPDLVWSPLDGLADMALSTSGLDLQANRGLRTAITIMLFTWRRVAPYELPAIDGSNLQGWWGDSVDVDAQAGERPLGSKLWLLRRSVLTPATEAQCKVYVQEALQPLLDMGVAARIDVQTASDIPRGLLTFVVGVFGKDGATIYEQAYQWSWVQEFPREI